LQGAKPFVLWRQHISFNLVLNGVACVKFKAAYRRSTVWLCQMTLRNERHLPLVDHKQSQTKGKADEQPKPKRSEPAATRRPARPRWSARRPEAGPRRPAAGRAEQARTARWSAALIQSQRPGKHRAFSLLKSVVLSQAASAS